MVLFQRIVISCNTEKCSLEGRGKPINDKGLIEITGKTNKKQETTQVQLTPQWFLENFILLSTAGKISQLFARVFCAKQRKN